LTKEHHEMTDTIIRVLQNGIDRVDYEDLSPYIDVLGPFFAIEDSLQYYRMEKMFSRANGSNQDLGILALIAKYKLNKSQGPSRYAYVLVKQLLALAQTNQAFDYFLGTVRSPVAASKVGSLVSSTATTTEPAIPSFVSWAGEFLKDFQAASEADVTGSIIAKNAAQRERRDSATLTLEQFVAFEVRARGYVAPVAVNRCVWQDEKVDQEGGSKQQIRLTLYETTFNPGPKETRLTLVADSTVAAVATVDVQAPMKPGITRNYNFPPVNVSIPAMAKQAPLCVVRKKDNSLDWGDYELNWSWSSGGQQQRQHMLQAQHERGFALG